jgi:hypothetical protein
MKRKDHLEKLIVEGLMTEEEANKLRKESKPMSLRSADRVNDSTFTRIWKFYYEKSDIELKEKEEEIRHRLVNIWRLLADVLTDRQAVLAHMQWCRDEGLEISERTAYEDLRFTKMLFGDSAKQSKAMQKAIVNEWLIWGINKAKKDGSLKAFALLIRRYNALNALEGDQSASGARPPIQIVFDSDPQTLKNQMDELRRKAEAANAKDVDFTEVSE